jgi:hypothetical protein
MYIHVLRYSEYMPKTFELNNMTGRHAPIPIPILGLGLTGIDKKLESNWN